eukprot:TRINITY_DN22195_c0_g1_i1.p1 TRINITY_DN22195_c0_g1~~TRINITY_DN22195_c0_g1_i1.p1  ORF type:complete len:286 (+),score=34.23 TRINITY_DN22195_c0_g1_i1:91-948(+)
MSLGPPPKIPAHDVDGGCLRPRRDRERDSERRPVPPVPRTQRAKPRANSCGALRKASWSRASGCPSGVDRIGAGSPTMGAEKPSELRRPRAESPFNYARVNSITRERDSIENQIFEMGPRRNIIPEIKNDFSRGHILGRENEHNGNGGMPWDEVCEKSAPQPGPRDHSRRRTLHHERQAADQALEWVPTNGAAAPAGPKEPRPRVNTLRREEKEGAHSIEYPGSRPTGCTSGNEGQYGRRSVLRREQGKNELESFPTPRGNAGGYGKKNLILNECPIQPKVIGAC